MRLNWQWLIWQIGVPLGGPVILSWLIVLVWQTGNPDFIPEWNIVLDVSPWALTSYSLALIGASMNALWPRISSHPFIGCSLICVASLTSILLAAIFLCYSAYQTQEDI
jgi:hypothetical protein